MKTLKLLLLALIALSSSVGAHDYTIGGMRIDHPWSHPLPEVSRNGAAYMELSNRGAAPDRLISASSPIAERVQLHTHMMEDDVMRMRPMEAIEVVPGKAAVLQPGGLHIMLMGLKEPLTEGKTFPLTLNFERAGSIQVTVTVEEGDSDQDGHSGHSKQSGQGG